MPAFGCNWITRLFALRVRREPTRGFRLSDRIVSAIDRFVGALSCFRLPGENLMDRWLFIYPFVGGFDWTHSLNLADTTYNFANPLANFNSYAITWAGTVTHNQFGVTMASGSTGSPGIDMADITTYGGRNWNRRSHGIYSRTNIAVNVRDFQAAFVEPRNGYTYVQGLIARYSDGSCIADLCLASKTGQPTLGNRAQAAVADSLGLFTDNQRGTLNPSHYLYKRGAYIAGDPNTGETGMGYGDVGSGAWLYLQGCGRNYAFFFSTTHTRTLEGPVNFDGTGGQWPGSNTDFNYFVEQLQVALVRNV